MTSCVTQTGSAIYENCYNKRSWLPMGTTGGLVQHDKEFLLLFKQRLKVKR